MPQYTACSGSRSAGFSLVEVLCALAIAAMAMVVLLRGVGSAQRASNLIETHLGARIIAHSILQDELMASETRPEQRRGDSGLYQWTLTIAPASVNGVGRLPSGYRLYRLSVDVQWQQRGNFAAETLKLAQ